MSLFNEIIAAKQASKGSGGGGMPLVRLTTPIVGEVGAGIALSAEEGAALSVAAAAHDIFAIQCEVNAALMLATVTEFAKKMTANDQTVYTVRVTVIAGYGTYDIRFMLGQQEDAWVAIICAVEDNITAG